MPIQTVPKADASSAPIQLPYRHGAGKWYDRIGWNDLDGMPIADYLANYKGRLKQCTDYKRRDTRIIMAATTVAKDRYHFFQKPVGDSEKTLDGGTTIAVKDESLTNAVEVEKLEAGAIMVVESVQVRCMATSREFNAFAANSGEPSDATPAAAGTISASNSIVALIRNTYLTVTLGRDRKVEGRLTDFPPEGIVTGFAGGDTDEGVVQIGNGRPHYLSEIFVLKQMRHYTAVLEFFRATIFPQNLEIEIALCGPLFESVG